MKLKLFAMLAFCLVLLAPAMALTVTGPSTVAVTQGRTIDVQVSLYNDLAVEDGVVIYLLTNLPTFPTLSENIVVLSEFTRVNLTLTIDAADANPGEYVVALSISHTEGDDVIHKNISVEVSSPVRITPVYSGILSTRGAFEYLKYTVQNLDSKNRNMVIDCSPVPEEFDAACPESFFLKPGESQEVHVGIVIPHNHPTGEYSVAVRLASGEFSAISAPVLLSVGDEPLPKPLEIKRVMLGIYKQNGGTSGYNVTLELKAARDFENVSASGLPTGWKLENAEFNISEGEQNASFIVIPADFAEHKFELTLIENGFSVASAPLLFSGSAIGMTGFAIGDGSVTVGILLAVIIALVLLYVRLKGRFSEVEEENKTVKYFENLLDKAKQELAGTEPAESTTGDGAIAVDKASEKVGKEQTNKTTQEDVDKVSEKVGEEQTSKTAKEEQESEEDEDLEGKRLKQEKGKGQWKRILKETEKQLEDADGAKVLKEGKKARKMKKGFFLPRL